MLVAACLCPHPPLLLPGVCLAEPDWLDELRAACASAVRRLIAARPERVVVVGGASTRGSWDETAGGTMAPFGAVGVRAGGPDDVLPLALTVGAHLLDVAGWTGPRGYLALDALAPAAEQAATGRGAVAGPARTALLVLGDGSAKRSTRAPGYLDHRAAGFDRVAVEALRTRDAPSLFGLDHVLAEQLWVAGVAGWRALAGAWSVESPQSAPGVVQYDAAPLGVGYFVITWAG